MELYWLILCLISTVAAQQLGTDIELKELREKEGEGDPVGLDPDVWLSAVELITTKGYPCEQHTVQTEDGYILTLHRIPYGTQTATEKKGAVLVVHCLECDSTVFITNFPSQSLGFILADAGYDVWLANVRGTRYSRTHIKYKQRQWEFWKWTWDEMAKYDIPAFVDYVTNYTNQSQIHYVGFSQGTLTAFAAFSTNQEVASKIKLYSALAPVAQLGQIESPLRYFAGLVEKSEWLYRLLGYGKFLPPTNLMNHVEARLCSNVDVLFKWACVEVYYLVGGMEVTRQLNTSRLDVYFSHTPSGTSYHNVNHYAQMTKSGAFQAYDWGSKRRNKEHYGQPTPPVYDPQDIKIPVALFSGQQDTLADPKDVEWLQSKLTNLVFSKQYEQFDHLDFIWGLRAASTVYADMIELMDKY